MNRSSLIFGLFWTILGIAIWLYSGSFPTLDEGYPGPALFPRFIAVGLVGAGLWLMFVSWKHPKGVASDGGFVFDSASLFRLGMGFGLVICFTWIRAWFGVPVALGVLIFGMAMVLKPSLTAAAGSAVAGALVIYGLFTYLLGVPL